MFLRNSINWEGGDRVMKIVRKDKKRCVPFDAIRKGDFFESGNEVYLKISGGELGELNAYNCSRDTPTVFGFGDLVIPLNAKVVIE